MNLLDEIKEIVKEKRKKIKKEQMDPVELMFKENPDIKRSARELVKVYSNTEARKILNEKLKEMNLLPKDKNDEPIEINRSQFDSLLPRKRTETKKN